MHAMLRSSTRFLDRPLSLASRGVVLLGIVALVAGAFLPLWGIQLVAPQYQEGLSLQMYTTRSPVETVDRTCSRSTRSTTTSA